MSVEHVVKKGECLSSIAKTYHFADWRKIYDHPENADFKKKRPNPDLIYPGDVVMIPDKKPAPAVLANEQVHVVTIKTAEARLRLLLEVDEPYAYELEADGKVKTGQVDGKTLIDHPIPGDLAEARLTVWPASGDRSGAITWQLDPGYLDPIDEVSGVQGRLANLGYYWGQIDGQPGADLDLAVSRFRYDEKLDPGSSIDDDLRSRLQKRHDGV